MNTGNRLQLSILDFVHIYKGSDARESLQNITEMVQLAEQWGYMRYLFTEHHNTTTLMSTSPDLLSLHAAAHTKSIRVGSGGIMLPNHSPLKVMENFTLLEGLYPGRVDLGIGRASGADGWTMWALLRSRELTGVNDFPEQLHHIAKASLVNEIMIADFYPNQESRKKGHELLANELGLSQGNT